MYMLMRGARYPWCEMTYGRNLVLGAEAGRNSKGGGSEMPLGI